MTTDTQSLSELDRARSLHPYTMLAAHLERGPLIITEGEGIRVRDSEGREYIDAMAGLWCVNVGWGRNEIADAMAEQARRLAYYHSFTGMANEPAIHLADKVLAHAPEGMSKVFFGCTGSDANDTNVKLTWYYNNLLGRPEKKKILSRHRAYHGVTLAAASLSGLSSMHQKFDLPLSWVRHLDAPHHYQGAAPGMSEREFAQQLAGQLEQVIEEEGAHTIAAMIAEPVQGAGGVILPPEGYFEAIVPILRRHDILLIADEVVCGFGRLGTWFGSHAYGLEPDLMTLAKGLSSGYAPISATVVSDRIWRVMLEADLDGYFAHGFTYSCHPVSCAAALANLDIVEREDLVGNAARVGEHFQRRLRERFEDHPHVGEVRGMGLIGAVELVADKAKKTPYAAEQKIGAKLAGAALEEGLICRALPQSNAVSFSPPLSITAQECDEVVERLGVALEKIASELAV